MRAQSRALPKLLERDVIHIEARDVRAQLLWRNYDVTLWAKTRKRVSILALPAPSSQSQNVFFFFMGFWLNPLHKVRGLHKLKILSRFILRHKTHQLHHSRDFLFKKLLRFLKTVANKLLNGTTGAVGDIKRHLALNWTFINLQYLPVVVCTINFIITN